MTRLPIRVRVTLAYAVAMLALFATLAVLLPIRVADQLDATIDEGLRARATDLAAQPTTSHPQPHDSDARFIAIRVGGLPYGPRTVTRQIDGEATRIRELATRSGPRLVTVGQNLEARDEALDGLKSQLAVGLPLGLTLTCLAGYLAAAGALRPVAAMTRRARDVSAGDENAQLPVPDRRDEIAELGHTLNDMLARLHAAIKRERAFVADASHELRTPLTTIGDGSGFPPAFTARAFDRFSVADPARQGAHAGLGLAIVAAIANAHGWSVQILTPSTVEVRMPALQLETSRSHVP